MEWSIQEIEVNGAETDPLIGMSLFRGYRLQIDTIPSGLVTISTLFNPTFRSSEQKKR